MVGVVLSLVLAAGGSRTVDEVFAPGDESVWTVEIGGKRCGQHWSRYVGVADLPDAKAHAFTAGVHLKTPSALGELEQKYRCDLWTDPQGHVLKADLRAEVGGTFSRVTLRVANGKAAASITQGPSSRDVEIDAPKDPFLLANNFISHLEVLFALHPLGEKESATHQILLGNALQAIPYPVRWTKRFSEQADGETVEGDVIQDSLVPGGEQFFVTADGRLLRMEVPSQKLVMRRVSETPETIDIKTPEQTRLADRFSTEEVTIAHDGAKLAGTLSRPKQSTGKLPAIFFVSGSGLQDRNGLSSGIDLGTHEVLDHLTEAGFATLRVDDRGVGSSTGPIKDLRYDDLLADARACVDFLIARKDVDATRIAVIGHSEGGLTAMILARERPQLAAIVLMAAAGRGLLDVIRDQQAAELDRQGIKDPERARLIAAENQYLDLMCSDKEIKPEDLPESDARSALSSRAWMKSHLHRDPIAELKSVSCPVLLVQGADDLQVSPERDAKRLVAALDATQHRDHELHVFPKLDHLFKKTTGDKPDFAEYYKPRPVDPEFLDVLTQWLAQRLKR